MGRYAHFSFFGRPRKADREAALQALACVGMASFAKRQIGELSGGQQQRLFFARALVQQADLFFLDEPFQGVDLATEKMLIEILKKEKACGKSIFVVHHDLPTVAEYFDWAILLHTRVVAYGPVQSVLTRENLRKTFGKDQPLFDEVATLAAQARLGEM